MVNIVSNAIKYTGVGGTDHMVPIFAMTANTLTKDRKDCEDAGMNGYISKPINLKDIGNTLNVTYG